MYAIVEINGKQYKVSEGDIIFVDRMESSEEGSSVEFANVLLISNDKKVTVGEEYIKGAKVKATVISHGKDKKIIVYKYKAKKNQRKTKGHRQPYTKIQVTKITASSRAKKEENVNEESAL